MKTNLKRDNKNQPEQLWPFPMYWFATTVEGPFGVGTGGIFTTIVRVVQAFV